MDPSDRATLERLEQQIRELAYLLWEAGGRQHGRSLEHWLDAERRILDANAAARHTAAIVEVVTATHASRSARATSWRGRWMRGRFTAMMTLGGGGDDRDRVVARCAAEVEGGDVGGVDGVSQRGERVLGDRWGMAERRGERPDLGVDGHSPDDRAPRPACALSA